MPDASLAAADARVDTREQIEALLAEINAVAARFKQAKALLYQRENLPAAGRGVLQILEQRGPQTVPQIARIRSTSRQNIQTLVNRLLGEGCVELAGNPAHKRSALVYLTERGEDLLATTAGRETGLAEMLQAHVSEPAVATAAGLLREIRQVLGGSASQLARLPEAPRKAKPGKKAPRRIKPRGSVALDRSKAEWAPSASDAHVETELPVNLL